MIVSLDSLRLWGTSIEGAAKSTGEISVYMLVPVSSTSRDLTLNYLPITSEEVQSSRVTMVQPLHL
jgi:hypothetical protein